MMKAFEDIFSNKEIKEKKEEKEKIIVDKREKNSLVIANLIKINAKISLEYLEVGDYIIKDLIIERKTINDFLSSIFSGRLKEQVKNLENFERRLLIIEGYDANFERVTIHKNVIKGAMLSITIDSRIPIIYTLNELDTAETLDIISKRMVKEKNPYCQKKFKKMPKNLYEQKQQVLESFPGIGSKKAKKLIENFGSIRRIFEENEENLNKIIGKKEAKKFIEIINN